MKKLITEEVAFNMAQHCKEAWEFATPNASTGETIIQRGLLPFFPNTQKKGGPLTIVDIKVDNIALDVKCREVLEIYNKPVKNKNPNKTYYKIDEIGITVARPNSVETPVRRPNVDVENYKGNGKIIVNSQIDEYRDFANRTTAAANCDTLNSILFLYGSNHNYKAIYIEEQAFSTPTPAEFKIYSNKKGLPTAYLAYDQNQKLLYRLTDYSKGSTNFIKRFDCSTGYIFVWEEQLKNTNTHSKQNWLDQGHYFF